jgi:hypothetical protein
MKARQKLNINDTQSVLMEDNFGNRDEVLIKRGEKTTRFQFPDSGEPTAAHSRKPSLGPNGGWREISIDTLNLTPKSQRSKTNSPINGPRLDNL